MKKYILVITLFLALLSCERMNDTNRMEINVNEAEIVNDEDLNKYIEELDFFIVDTTQIIFNQVNKIISDDSFIILLTGKGRKEVIVIDKDSKLFGRINYYGGGPGEFKNINDITYNFKTKEIIIYDIVSRSLFSYDLKGTFRWQKKIDLQAEKIITDDEYYYFYTNKLFSELGANREVVVLDSACKKVNSFFKYKEEPFNFRLTISQVFSRNDKNQIFYSNVFRDTIYQVSNKNCVPYLILKFDEKIPTKYTQDADSYNNNSKHYVFNHGLFSLNEKWICFRIKRKGNFKDLYLKKDHDSFIETAYTQLSKNIYLSNPLGNDSQNFYYAILPQWIEEHKEEFYDFLKKYDHPELIAYFNKNLLYFNPIIVRVKFVSRTIPV